MIGSSTVGFGAAVLLAAKAANGIVIPMNMEMFAPFSNELSPIDSSEPQYKVLKVPCPDCPAELTGNDFENALVFNISVGRDLANLEINSVPFYPPSITTLLRGILPSVPLVKSDASIDEIQAHPQLLLKNSPVPVTSWVVKAYTTRSLMNGGNEIVDIDLRVKSLAKLPVHIPRIQISAVKDSNSRFNLEKASYSDEAESESEDDDSGLCQSSPLVCRLHELAMNRVNMMSGSLSNLIDRLCGNIRAMLKSGTSPFAMPGHRIILSRPPVFAHPQIISLQPLHTFDPSPVLNMDDNVPSEIGVPPPQHQTPIKESHSFGYYIKRGFLYVVAPFMFGMASAASVYLLTMAIGYGIAASWRRIKGTRKVDIEGLEDGSSPLLAYEDEKEQLDGAFIEKE